MQVKASLTVTFKYFKRLYLISHYSEAQEYLPLTDTSPEFNVKLNIKTKVVLKQEKQCLKLFQALSSSGMVIFH